MYVKLFGTIVNSSIWDEDIETRLVWITLLVTADETGFVRTTITALGRTANVSDEAVEKAVDVLTTPDPNSGSPKDNGRRIRPVPGGFQLTNYQEYREVRTKKQLQDAQRQTAKRAREVGNPQE